MPSWRLHRVTARRSSRRFRATAQAACGNGRTRGLATQRFVSTCRGPRAAAERRRIMRRRSRPLAGCGVRIATDSSQRTRLVRASTRMTLVLLVGWPSQSLEKQTILSPVMRSP